jgi:methionyl-tRNA formyltransferase
VLHGSPTGITTFFIDEGIDTGPRIVLREPIEVSQFCEIRDAKNYLFSLNGVMFAKALDTLRHSETTCLFHQKKEDGKRYYVMSNLFTEVVSQLLKAHDA